MRITADGFDWCLVKYIGKKEPTFGLYVVAQNEVQKHLHAAVIQMSHPIVKSNI